jgi:hypothetical protein
MEYEHYTVTDVFSTELGIRLSFVKTSEFRGGGWFEPPKPPLGTPLRRTELKDEILLGASAKLRLEAISFFMSVCPSAWSNSPPTGQIFARNFSVFFENMSGKLIQIDKNDG